MGGQTGDSEVSREEGGSGNNQVRQQPYLSPLYQRSYRAKMIGVDLSERAREVIDPTLQLLDFSTELPLSC